MRRKTPPTETPLIIMKGISDFSSSKLLAKVSLASGGGAPEMGKHLVNAKNDKLNLAQNECKINATH